MPKETIQEKRQRFMETAKAAIAGAYASDEHSVMQAINSYNSIEKMKNLMYERLEEWYSIYFPELRLTTTDSYAKFVLSFGKAKKEHDPEAVRKALGEKGEAIHRAMQESIGREPADEEYKAMKAIAEAQLELGKLQERLDEYIKATATVLMPNITYLVDYKIAAELLAKAGSLQRLAMMPASTIQLLGAEKALFKHIKFGTRPPKYGILYKMQVIQSAGKHNGGRLARLYATKISIASKADAFSKNFIADKLKESIDKYTPKQEGERKNAVRYEDSAQAKAFRAKADSEKGSSGRFGSMGRKYERQDSERPRYRDAGKQEFRDNKSSFRDNYKGDSRPAFRRDEPKREERGSSSYQRERPAYNRDAPRMEGSYQRERPDYRPSFRPNDRPEGRNYSRDRPEGAQRERPSFQRPGSSFSRERPYRPGHGSGGQQGPREREGFRPRPNYGGGGGSSYNRDRESSRPRYSPREGQGERPRPRYVPREGQGERSTGSYSRSSYKPRTEGGYRSEGTRTTAASRPEFRKKFSGSGEKREGEGRGRYDREGSRPPAKKFRKKR